MKLKHIHILLFIFVIVKIFFLFTKFHLVEWDESVYLGIGKYFYSFGKVGLLENIRPPALPLLLGALWKLNLDYIFWADILELVFSLGCIYMTYRIARLYFSENKSTLAALIFMFTPIFFYNSLRIMTEIPSTFFVLLAAYFFIRERYWLVGLFLGVSFLFKYPYGLMLIAFLLSLFFIFLRERDFRTFFFNCLKIVAMFFLAVLPLLVFNHYSYGDALQPLIDASFHQSNVYYKISNSFVDVLFFPLFLLSSNLFLLFCFPTIHLFFRSRRFVFLVFILIPLFYFSSIINKQLRFAIVFLPFLAIMSSYGIFYVCNRAKHLRHYTSFVVSVLIFAVIVVGINAVVLYRFFPGEKPGIVDEFYTFLPDSLDAPVLISDPVFAAYSDLRYIPYYASEPNSVYDKYINSSAAIVYTPYAFPCFDEYCNLSINKLEAKINSNILVFSKKYGGTNYIYLNKDYFNS